MGDDGRDPFDPEPVLGARGVQTILRDQRTIGGAGAGDVQDVDVRDAPV